MLLLVLSGKYCQYLYITSVFFYNSFTIHRSNPMLTFVQVFSRVFVTWAIVATFPESQICLGFPLLLLAWIITEIIRYAFYALNLIGIESSIIVWLRYTLFIVLYPMGVTGELWCTYTALTRVGKERMFSIAMPNRMNFTFDFYVFLILLMLSYIPIFPQLYFHMFAQRKKIIGGANNKKTH